MTRCAVLATGGLALGLSLGLFAGWKLGRLGTGLQGQLIRVARTPQFDPVRIVPDSVNWPAGEPVTVQTVAPPSNKVARKLERDFGLDLNRTSLLGKFDLPDMPDGGSAVVSVPVSDRPEPVSLTVKANPPPLVRVRWDPRIEAWYGYSTEGNIWSSYLELDRLLCIRDRVCGMVRAGYERRPWGQGAVVEAGVSVRF